MQKNKPLLYIFSGLPATGKTTLSRLLAKETGALHLRIDTIEQALRDLCLLKVEGEGYRLAYRVAADNLKIWNSVIADSCNPIKLTRDEWEETALKSGADFVNIEIKCKDVSEHRKRVDCRQPDIKNLKLPVWAQVESREYHHWDKEIITVDTSGKTVLESFKELQEKLLLSGYNSKTTESYSLL